MGLLEVHEIRQQYLANSKRQEERHNEGTGLTMGYLHALIEEIRADVTKDLRKVEINGDAIEHLKDELNDAKSEIKQLKEALEESREGHSASVRALGASVRSVCKEIDALKAPKPRKPRKPREVPTIAVERQPEQTIGLIRWFKSKSRALS